MRYFSQFALFVGAFFLLTSCASKNDEYNKPADYWYNKMIKHIGLYQLDVADDIFVSLESEHKNSPLIPSALLILANAHMDEEEYQMAEYYLDEYTQRFVFDENIAYIRYLKIKAKYLAFKQQFRQQDLLQQTIVEVEDFLNKYGDSEYAYLVYTIQSRLYMAKASFDAEIASLYERIQKPKAQKHYEKKAKQSWKDQQKVEPVEVPWYRWIFE